MDWKKRVSAAIASADGAPDPDVVEELAQHARALYDAARAEGRSHDAADRAVSELLDGWRRESHELRRRRARAATIEPPPAASTSPVAGLIHDIRYAFRLLRRQRGYTLLVASTLALGIGTTTALFAVAYGVLMKPLPWPEAERLVVLEETRGGRRPRFGSFTNAAYLAWREDARTLEDIAAWSQRTATLADAGDPERILITSATANLFTILRAQPLAGTLFDPRDETAARGRVIVLSESLWRQRFGADHAVAGRIVRIDGDPHAIVGVLPDVLAFPDRRAKAWVPFRVPPPDGNLLSMFDALGRLRPGVAPAQAAAEGTARGRFAADTGLTTTAIFGGAGPIGISAIALRDATTADVRRPLLVLLAAVGLLLLTATANVASLQLARATTRRRELAIKAALGAGVARVVRQLTVESLLLGALGGGAGLAIAWLLHALLPAVLPPDFPRAGELALDRTAVAFAVLASIATSAGFGVLPSMRVRQFDLVGSLSDDGGGAIGSDGRSGAARLRLTIMAGQVAIACVLLVGASLLGRSFIALVSADRGYEPAHVVAARLPMAGPSYTPGRRYALANAVLARVSAVPGMADAAFASELPLAPGGSTTAFQMRSPRDAAGVVQVQASPRIVSPRYFAVIGMRLVEGRGFTDADTESSLPVAVVNRAFARRYLGDAPLGARLPMGAGYQNPSTEATVVGVVEDVRYVSPPAPTPPEVYYSHRQMKGVLPVPGVTIVVRTSAEAAAVAPLLRMAAREADPLLAPDAASTLQDRLAATLARPRLYAALIVGLAVCALAVAGVGLFGVLSYSVAQRTREFAVRTALGARRIDIARLVLGRALAITGVGAAAGIAASIVLMRSLGTLLYGVGVYDGFTYAAVPLIVLAVAVSASLGPARRAAGLDPLRALRS